MLKNIQKLSLAEVEYVAHDLAKRLMTWSEPIPAFSSRYPQKLESCISQPFVSFGSKQLYAGLTKKAAILFYLMNKNHPFQNGNKRVAVTTLLYFLSRNDTWLKVDPQELYNFAKWVAESPAAFKDQVLDAIEKFIDSYQEPF